MDGDGPGGLSANGSVGRVFLLALIVAFGLQWKSCIEPSRMSAEWLAAPHWSAPASQEFHADDRGLRYQRFSVSPLANALYTTLSRTGIDAAWGKLNGILWFAGTAVLVFMTAALMAPGRWAGWAAAATFVLFPSRMELFVGGSMSGLSVPLLCLTVLVAYRGRYGWAVPLLLLQSLVDPTLALHSGLLLALVCLRRPRALFEPDAWKRTLLPLALAAIVCAAVIGVARLSGSDEFGELVSRSDIANRVEFSAEGPAPILPTASMLAQLMRQLGSVSFLATCLLAFLVLGKRMLDLPRGLYALLLASLGMLCLADVLMMQLAVPASYMARGVPLFAALTTGVWVGRMTTGERRVHAIIDTSAVKLHARPAVLGILLLALIGFYEHRQSIAPTGALGTVHSRNAGLYEAVRQLPGGITLAAHPDLANELPFMAGRSVVISSNMVLPWFTKHWRWSEERLHDVLRAHYAVRPETLIEVTRKYEIDYWVVDRRRYRTAFLESGGMMQEPFRNWARLNLRPAGSSVLRRVPQRYRHWDDGRTFFIVAAEDLERWADGLDRRP